MKSKVCVKRWSELDQDQREVVSNVRDCHTTQYVVLEEPSMLGGGEYVFPLGNYQQFTEHLEPWLIPLLERYFALFDKLNDKLGEVVMDSMEMDYLDVDPEDVVAQLDKILTEILHEGESWDEF